MFLFLTAYFSVGAFIYFFWIESKDFFIIIFMACLFFSPIGPCRVEKYF